YTPTTLNFTLALHDALPICSNASASRDFGEHVKFTIGENIVLSHYGIDEMDTNPIVDVYRMLPTISIYDPRNHGGYGYGSGPYRSEEHTSELQSRENLVCRL